LSRRGGQQVHIWIQQHGEVGGRFGEEMAEGLETDTGQEKNLAARIKAVDFWHCLV